MATYTTATHAALVVALIGLSSPCSAGAAFKTGSELLTACEETGTYLSGGCYGYIMGVADSLGIDEIAGYSACVPVSSVNGRQLRDIAINWLRSNPQTQDFPAAELVAQAISKAFPCP